MGKRGLGGRSGVLHRRPGSEVELPEVAPSRKQVMVWFVCRCGRKVEGYRPTDPMKLRCTVCGARGPRVVSEIVRGGPVKVPARPGIGQALTSASEGTFSREDLDRLRRSVEASMS